MPVTPLPAQWVHAQPRIRSRQDDYRATVTVSWTDGHDPLVTVGLTIEVGESEELVSLFVGPQVATGTLYTVLTDVAADLTAWVRRTRDPFDDLL